MAFCCTAQIYDFFRARVELNLSRATVLWDIQTHEH